MARVPIASYANGSVTSEDSGRPIPGAEVRVYTHGTTTAVPVFPDETSTVALPQPLLTGADGRVPGYLEEDQTVDLVVTYLGITYPAAQINVERGDETEVSSVAGRTGAVTLTVADVSGAEATANKGQPSGYPSLGAGGLIPNSQTLLDQQVETIERLRERVYGEVYVPEGVPVAAFGFDDGPAGDFSSIYPLFRDAGQVASFCVNYGGTNAIGSGGRLSWANLNEMRLHGMEVINHSRTHGATPTALTGSSGDGSFQDEAILSADDLAAGGSGGVPFNVEMFTQPGTWNSGAYNFDDPTKIDLTDQGRFFRSRYVGATAYITDAQTDSGQTPLPSFRRYGIGRSLTLEQTATTLAKVQAQVGLARGLGTGAVFFNCHFSNLGLGGFNTLATVTTILNWLFAEAAAGRLVILTYGAALHAKPRATGRRNLFSPDASAFLKDAQGNPSLWQTLAGSPVYNTGDGQPGSGNSLSVPVGAQVMCRFPAAPMRTVVGTFWAKNANVGVPAKLRLVLKGLDATLVTPYGAVDMQSTNPPPDTPNAAPWNAALTDSWQQHFFAYNPDPRSRVVQLTFIGKQDTYKVSNIAMYRS